MPSYPISAPPIIPSRESINLTYSQAISESEWSGKVQTIQRFTRWKIDLEFSAKTLDDAALYAGWLDSLRGSAGSFYYSPRRGVYTIEGTKTATVTAFTMATTIQISGWAAGAATGLRVGQFLSISDRLNRIVTAPVNADASGRAIIELAAPLRSDVAAGTVINFNTPRGIFRRVDEDGSFASGFTSDVDRVGYLPSLAAAEVL